MNAPSTKTPRRNTLLLLASPLLAISLHAQTHPAAAPPAHSQEHLRSRLFLYDLRDHSSRLLYTADTVWEAPNWSPDGTYLIANSGGAIYKLLIPNSGESGKPGTAQPEKLAIPASFRCNNDKALSPDGTRLAFSATAPPGKDSQVFLSDADGSNVKLLASETPSYFHGWSPDNHTLAFVAQRHGSGQYDIYRMPAAGGPEQQLTSNPHQDDGPDYSPDGRWIYINSDRSGKQAIWRFPADGAGPNDAKAELVVNDTLEDWFPHIAPDGQKMVYIGYPAGTPTHNPRNVSIEIKLVTIEADKPVTISAKTLIQATGGQGTMNVNSWAPDSLRFAYVTYEPIP